MTYSTRFVAMLLALMAAPVRGALAGGTTVAGHIATGYAAPAGEASDLFNSGWNVSGGATFHFEPMSPFGLRLDLRYGWADAKKQDMESIGGSGKAHVDAGRASMTSLSVDAMYEFGGKRHVGGRLGAGIGGYSRYATLTRTIQFSQLSCDPIWPGACFLYTGERVVENDDRLTTLGFDVSAAITFPLDSGSEIYIEGSLNWTESDPATTYLPINVGYRW